MPRTVPLVRSGDGSAVLPGGLQRRASVEYGRRTGDMDTKRVAVSCLSRIIKKESAGRMNVNQKEIGKFSALYTAVILKGFRKEHQGDFRRKAEEAMEGRGKEHVEGAPGGTCFWLGRPVHRGPGQK